MAVIVKPNAPATTRNGIAGSADSCEPGFATTTFITVYSTPSGQNQGPRQRSGGPAAVQHPPQAADACDEEEDEAAPLILELTVDEDQGHAHQRADGQEEDRA